jgi:hypothetical protein
VDAPALLNRRAPPLATRIPPCAAQGWGNIGQKQPLQHKQPPVTSRHRRGRRKITLPEHATRIQQLLEDEFCKRLGGKSIRKQAWPGKNLQNYERLMKNPGRKSEKSSRRIIRIAYCAVAQDRQKWTSNRVNWPLLRFFQWNEIHALCIHA